MLLLCGLGIAEDCIRKESEGYRKMDEWDYPKGVPYKFEYKFEYEVCLFAAKLLVNLVFILKFLKHVNNTYAANDMFRIECRPTTVFIKE